MRDKPFYQKQFLEQLEIFFNRKSPRITELKNHVIVNPNFLSENYLVLPYDLKGILALSIGSWWVPKELGFLIREDIREKRLKRFNLEDQFLIEICLTRRAYCLNFLNETRIWHSRDFFGNFTEEIMKRLNRLRFRRIDTKVVHPERKRGYDDHGSRVEDSRWLPKSDWSLTDQQNAIEEQRKSQEDTLNFTLGFLE